VDTRRDLSVFDQAFPEAFANEDGFAVTELPLSNSCGPLSGVRIGLRLQCRSKQAAAIGISSRNGRCNERRQACA